MIAQQISYEKEDIIHIFQRQFDFLSHKYLTLDPGDAGGYGARLLRPGLQRQG